ncbi:hypothetical protein FA10DRAFT_268710 [Acaromyces ingoldii]|uniref:BZIP domain-containing protein n=1 Tax=Acaromyces ingoldii TaxID=215250 RepID=A0A316YLC4_9BASI|nr:hypothetical protein FA10DRAFT_268710 [Acaromyces ingoldii]PWN88525.1 hypothetical protein FA10DRAFT_268710 [Acaromyces ingoldii]
MGRGRRPDTTLEPSRQLLTQRAFRQRRAAHLSELETRVKDLERENAELKALSAHNISSTAAFASTPGSGTGLGSYTGRDVVGIKGGSTKGDDEQQQYARQQCQDCLSHEKSRIDVLQSAKVVDSYFAALTSSILTLRQASQTNYNDASQYSHASGSYSMEQQRTAASANSLARLESVAQATGDQVRILVSKVSQMGGQLAVAGAFSAEPTPSPSPSSSKQMYSSSAFSAHSLGSPSTTTGFSQQMLSHGQNMTLQHGPRSPYLQQQQQQPAHTPFSAATQSHPASPALSQASEKRCRPSSNGGGCCPPSSSSLSSPMQPTQQGKPPPPTAYPAQASTNTHTNEARPRRGGMDMGISSQTGREDSQSGATPAPAADNSATSSWTQLGGDETKCCLGFFECDSEGKILIPSPPPTQPLQLPN